jgi:hypothetical protein
MKITLSSQIINIHIHCRIIECYGTFTTFLSSLFVDPSTYRTFGEDSNGSWTNILTEPNVNKKRARNQKPVSNQQFRISYYALTDLEFEFRENERLVARIP